MKAIQVKFEIGDRVFAVDYDYRLSHCPTCGHWLERESTELPGYYVRRMYVVSIEVQHEGTFYFMSEDENQKYHGDRFRKSAMFTTREQAEKDIQRRLKRRKR